MLGAGPPRHCRLILAEVRDFSFRWDIPIVLIKSQLGSSTVKHNLHLLQVVYKLTTTCFGLHIGHHQVVHLLVIRLTILTYSMVQSSSWAANWFAASQEIPRISALTSVHHLSLSWVSPIQSTYPHPTSWTSILILCTHLRLCLPSGLFPSGFPTKSSIKCIIYFQYNSVKIVSFSFYFPFSFIQLGSSSSEPLVSFCPSIVCFLLFCKTYL